MLIHNDIYAWEGWGGKLRLGSGSCRLLLYDLGKSDDTKKGVVHLKPFIAVISDIPESEMSVKSCTSHIATCVARDFRIDHHRMVWVEYYPASAYGKKKPHLIPEKFEAVEFEWHEDRAVHPRWRPLNPRLEEILRDLMTE